jgi:hypothetical protein
MGDGLSVGASLLAIREIFEVADLSSRASSLLHFQSPESPINGLLPRHPEITAQAYCRPWTSRRSNPCRTCRNTGRSNSPIRRG